MPLVQLPADIPFAILYIGIVGWQDSLSIGASSKSILKMIDGFTGWAEVVSIQTERSVTVAHAVYAELITRYGIFEQIYSDGGTKFKSALFKEFASRSTSKGYVIRRTASV